jgi:hypothetical protein
VNSGFGDDVRVEAVAEVNRVDVVTVIPAVSFPRQVDKERNPSTKTKHKAGMRSVENQPGNN